MTEGYPLPSLVIQTNIDLLASREIVGLNKYGHTLDRKDLSRSDLLRHGLEEALDLANYLQACLLNTDTYEEAYSHLRRKLADLTFKYKTANVRSSLDVVKDLMLLMSEHEARYPIE